MRRCKGFYNFIYISLPSAVCLAVFGIFAASADYADFSTAAPYFLNPIACFAEVIFFERLSDIFDVISLNKRCVNASSEIPRTGNYTILKFGQARSGKSFTGVVEAVFTAEALWSELTVKYLEMSRRAKLPKWQADELFMKRWKEVERSFEFWSDRPEWIPCLCSNIKIYKGERRSMDLTREHLDQKKWLPSYCVLFLDEVGRYVTIQESFCGNKPLQLADFVCWCGQFGEFHLIMTEQRPTNVPVDLRGVIGVNEQVVEKEKIFTAEGLLRFIDFLYDVAFRFDLKPTFFDKLFTLKSFAEKIGFWRFKMQVLGNMDLKENRESEREIFTFADLPFVYDSRAYSELYLAKDFADENTATEGLLLSRESPMARAIYKRYEPKKRVTGGARREA